MILKETKFKLSDSLFWEQEVSYPLIHLPRGQNSNPDICPTAGYYYSVYSSRLQADIPPKTWKTSSPTDVKYVLPTNLADLEKLFPITHSVYCKYFSARIGVGSLKPVEKSEKCILAQQAFPYNEYFRIST